MRVASLLASLFLVSCANDPATRVDRALEELGGAASVASVQSLRIDTEGSFGGATFRTRHYLRRPWDWSWSTGDVAMRVVGERPEVRLSMGGGRFTDPVRDRRTTSILIARATLLAFLPDVMLRDGVRMTVADSVDIGDATYRVNEVYFPGEARPLRVYFYSARRLVARVEMDLWDNEALRFVKTVTILDDYRPVGPVLLPHSFSFRWGNRMLIPERATSIELNPPIPAGTFDLPAPVAPREVKVRREEATPCAVVERTGLDRYAGRTDLLAWIGQSGGRATGPASIIFHEPTNFLHPEMNRTTTQLPVADVGGGDGIDVRRRGAFLFAYVRYDGPPAGMTNEWTRVHEWCAENGYARAGPPRLSVVSDKVTEVGFPVRKRTAWR